MDYMLLVNKQNKLSSSYIPSNLVVVDENENNFRGYADPTLKPMVDKNVFYAFLELQKDAKKDGYDFVICSGYRSYQYQETIFENFVESKGIEYAKKFVALPGTSEHQTGLGIDISAFHEGIYSDDLTEEETNWLKNNAHKYGFVLRYPEGKEQITGYNYEPWHYRYIDSLAPLFHEHNITLEEYYLNKEYYDFINSKNNKNK